MCKSGHFCPLEIGLQTRQTLLFRGVFTSSSCTPSEDSSTLRGLKLRSGRRVRSRTRPSFGRLLHSKRIETFGEGAAVFDHVFDPSEDSSTLRGLKLRSCASSTASQSPPSEDSSTLRGLKLRSCASSTASQSPPSEDSSTLRGLKHPRAHRARCELTPPSEDSSTLRGLKLQAGRYTSLTPQGRPSEDSSTLRGLKLPAMTSGSSTISCAALRKTPPL